MMRPSILFVLCLLCIEPSTTAFSLPQGTVKAVVPSDSQSLVGSNEQSQQRQSAFASARELLLNRGVPFAPDDLLDVNWRKRLKAVLDQMPEMKQVRYETAPLVGVYFAETLYLPEKVHLAGDTVIIAKHLVFEGRNPVVTGPHSVYVFPVFPSAVLGTSLTKALEKVGEPVVREGSTPPSFSIIERKLKLKPGHITFDVSAINPLPKTRH